MLAGVGNRVSHTLMQWGLRQRGWRALLIRVALLSALWPVVAFIFATEFYFSARGMPGSISWQSAAGNAFRDWFPWMLLSPLAVSLAGCFRFERAVWRRSLIIHLVACCLFSIAYAGLSFLAYPPPFAGSMRVSVTSDAGALHSNFSGFGAGGQEQGPSSPSMRIPEGTGTGGLVRGGFGHPPVHGW